jgi:rhodanese-related sulfurtransferase
LLEDARSRIERLTPAEADAAAAAGSLIVDIRAEGDRRRLGIVPGSVHVPRTVLEWRAAADSEWASPHLAGRRLIVLCDHGFSSSLAAATLVSLGCDAADVIGGFEAWIEAGLPVITAPEHDTSELPGMGPPNPGG